MGPTRKTQKLKIKNQNCGVQHQNHPLLPGSFYCRIPHQKSFSPDIIVVNRGGFGAGRRLYFGAGRLPP